MAVRRFETTAIEPYEGGRRFADGGAYEVVRGVARHAVDPTSEASSRIVDLDLAARDDGGLVHFASDVVVLRPADAARTRRTLVYSVANRGSVSSLPFSTGAFAIPGLSDRIVPGDAFLADRGYAVAWSGWQWDVVRGPGMVGVNAPEALGPDGRSVAGPVRVRVQPTVDAVSVPLTAMAMMPLPPPYPVADLADPDAVLTVRDRPEETGTVVPRGSWRFGRDDDGRFVADGTALWLDGGFRRGLIYDVVYRTERSPVVGAGLLAIRDVVSWLRQGSEAEGNPLAGRIDAVCATGASQSGRLLRQFLFDAMNLDEHERPVFDGVHTHIAGARRGEFNCRYGQPGVIWRGVGDVAPFSTDAVLERQRAVGGAPKVIVTNSAAEYWRGDAWLAHGDPVAAADLDDPPDVRHYAFAGVDHLGDLGELAAMIPAANPPASLDATTAERALFLALERWVTDDVVPPPSRVPRLADATAVPRAGVLERLVQLPGLAVPDVDALPGVGPALVSEIDADGNEVAGIRLPRVTVPLATFTGWNVRPAIEQRPALMPDFVGSCLPFAATAPARASRRDPRPSVAERHASAAEYGDAVAAAADALVESGLLLAGDAAAVVADAVARFPGGTR